MEGRGTITTAGRGGRTCLACYDTRHGNGRSEMFLSSCTFIVQWNIDLAQYKVDE